MTYVESALLPVPTANKEAYLRHAERMAAVFRKYGALSVVECWGVNVPDGEVNSMHTAVLRKPDETVVLSLITWSSRALRDEAWKDIMSDPAMRMDGSAMPMDGKRMIFGGFEAILEV